MLPGNYGIATAGGERMQHTGKEAHIVLDAALKIARTQPPKDVSRTKACLGALLEETKGGENFFMVHNSIDDHLSVRFLFTSFFQIITMFIISETLNVDKSMMLLNHHR